MATYSAQSFYSFTDPAPNSYGRTLEQILAWSDAQLASKLHTTIGSLFPLDAVSESTEPAKPYIPGEDDDSIPILTEDDFKCFRHLETFEWGLHYNLRRAFVRILRFYGFTVKRVEPKANIFTEVPQIEEDDFSVSPPVLVIGRASNYRKRFDLWVPEAEHSNHTYIARIIRSLRLLGCERQAQAFYHALEEVYYSSEYRDLIPKHTLVSWAEAAKRPLWNPLRELPDVIGESLLWFVDQNRESAMKDDTPKGERSSLEDPNSDSDSDSE